MTDIIKKAAEAFLKQGNATPENTGHIQFDFYINGITAKFDFFLNYLQQQGDDELAMGIILDNKLDYHQELTIYKLKEAIKQALAIGRASRQEWISVEDRLPNKDDLGFYLCHLNEVNDLGISKYIDVVWFNGEKFDTIAITHWQPLPPKP